MEKERIYAEKETSKAEHASKESKAEQAGKESKVEQVEFEPDSKKKAEQAGKESKTEQARKKEWKAERKKTYMEEKTKYSVQELEKAANTLFGVRPECVKAAFLLAGITEASEEDAKKLIADFMKGEV